MQRHDRKEHIEFQVKVIIILTHKIKQRKA